MTREEAIELLKRIKKGNYLGGIIDIPSDESIALEMAIKALEQEPSYNSVDSLVESKLKNPKAKTFDILHFIADNAGLSTYEAIEKAYIMGASGKEPCEDAISRKDIYFKLTNGAYPNETIEQFIDRLVKELDDLPPVTPQPKTGQWVNGEYCSECGCDVPAYIIDWKWQKDMDAKYCPNCGIKMKGKSEEV